MKTIELIHKAIGAICTVSFIIWVFGGNPDITEVAHTMTFTLLIGWFAIQNFIFLQQMKDYKGKFYEYHNELKKAEKINDDWLELYEKAEEMNESQVNKIDYLQKKCQSLSDKLDNSYAKNNDLNTELHTWKELSSYAAKIEFKSDKKYAADRIREMLESKFNNENKTNED